MRKPVAVFALVGSVVLAATFAGATLVPPQLPNAVVALGSMKPIGGLPGQPCVTQWATEGTGFLYGYLVQNDPDPTKRSYQVFLVTVRHVIEEHEAAQAISKIGQTGPSPIGSCIAAPTTDDSISVRLNPTNPSLPGREFDVPIKNWFFHPNSMVDIAAVPINAQFLKAEGLLESFIVNDDTAANKDKLKSLGVSAGDGVFVLGFPMNLAGIQRNYVIVRQGCIARISDMLDGYSPSYLVDALVPRSLVFRPVHAASRFGYGCCGHASNFLSAGFPNHTYRCFGVRLVRIASGFRAHSRLLPTFSPRFSIGTLR